MIILSMANDFLNKNKNKKIVRQVMKEESMKKLGRRGGMKREKESGE